MIRKTLFTPAMMTMLAVTAACSSEKQPGETLQKANQTHIEALAIAEHIGERLDSAKQFMTDETARNNLDSLADLIEQWEDGLVEVPGFTHEDHHGHGEHEHKPEPKMTDESMLEYQVNAKQAIVMIEGQVDQQLKTLKK